MGLKKTIRNNVRKLQAELGNPYKIFLTAVLWTKHSTARKHLRFSRKHVMGRRRTVRLWQSLCGSCMRIWPLLSGVAGEEAGRRKVLRPRAAKIKYCRKKFDLLCSTFFPVVQQPKPCLGRLIVEVSRSHTVPDTHPVWTPNELSARRKGS